MLNMLSWVKVEHVKVTGEGPAANHFAGWLGGLGTYCLFTVGKEC